MKVHLALLLASVSLPVVAQPAGPALEWVDIPAGVFQMGESGKVDAALGGPPGFEQGDFDEQPVHEFRLNALTRMSKSEVTVAQFRQFRPDCLDTPDGLVRGVTWYDAMAYCAWLSEREGKPCRLPTEAEWEHACRSDLAQPLGLQGMQSGPAEWCLDWYAPYDSAAVADAAGPNEGYAKVVRGGGISDYTNQEISLFSAYYARPANRASLAPDYPPRHLDPGLAGTVWGNVGFRVVQAELPPAAAHARTRLPFAQAGVRDTTVLAKTGPDPARPYFRRREVLPIPPDNTPWQEYTKLGIFPGVLPHFHSPAAVACDNGDLLVSYFTSPSSHTEYWPNVSFTLMRLRLGADEWDYPELFFDFADLVEETPLFFKDGATLWYITGGVGLPGVPFKWRVSTDHGASWGPVQFPRFTTPIGPHTAQPINSAFRDAAGVIYIASDGEGPSSVLWSSADNGQTWQDNGGRSGGRHTSYAVLKDGRILGMGGKNSNLEGYMPKSVSSNGGRTWTVSPTPFAALATNQRPTLLRLQSGRLFFAGDYQKHHDGGQPAGIHERGVYVALSEDEGETWHIKTLPLAEPHEKWSFADREGWWGPAHKETTIGYSVATQGPDGLIHLISSMNHPNLHFALNEAWILSDAGADETLMGAPTETEQYEDSAGAWTGGRDALGHFVLEGKSTWSSPSMGTTWKVEWKQGRRVGEESYGYYESGPLWQWTRAEPPALSTWTQFDARGNTLGSTQWLDRRLANR